MVRSDGTLKVLDFGVARRSPASFEAATTVGQSGTTMTGRALPVSLGTLTAPGTVVGTPFYMAPEQLRGLALDGRGRPVPACGGSLPTRLLTGAPPWNREAPPIAVIAEVLSQDPPPPHEREPRIGASLSRAILRALSKAPEARYPSMRELLLEIEGGATGAVGASGVPSHSPPRAENVTPAAPGGPLGASSRPRLVRWSLLVLGILVTAMLVAGGRRAILASLASHEPSALEGDIAAGEAAARRGGVGGKPGEPRSGRVSTIPSAAAAYEAALQAERDGNTDEMRRNLAATVAADPSVGAAHLRIALDWSARNGHNELEAYAAYQHAVEHRATLGEVDAAVLEALEPRFRNPPDEAERTRRLEQVVERYPRQAWLLTYLARSLASAGRLAESDVTLGRARQADPRYVPALYWQIVHASERRDDTQVATLVTTCLESSPHATACLSARMNVERNDGRCAELQADARRVLAIDPSSETGFADLANATLATGAPSETVAEVLRQASDQLSDPDQRRLKEARGAGEPRDRDGRPRRGRTSRRRRARLRFVATRAGRDRTGPRAGPPRARRRGPRARAVVRQGEPEPHGRRGRRAQRHQLGNARGRKRARGSNVPRAAPCGAGSHPRIHEGERRTSRGRATRLRDVALRLCQHGPRPERRERRARCARADGGRRSSLRLCALAGRRARRRLCPHGPLRRGRSAAREAASRLLGADEPPRPDARVVPPGPLARAHRRRRGGARGLREGAGEMGEGEAALGHRRGGTGRYCAASRTESDSGAISPRARGKGSAAVLRSDRPRESSDSTYHSPLPS